MALNWDQIINGELAYTLATPSELIPAQAAVEVAAAYLATLGICDIDLKTDVEVYAIDFGASPVTEIKYTYTQFISLTSSDFAHEWKGSVYFLCSK